MFESLETFTDYQFERAFKALEKIMDTRRGQTVLMLEAVKQTGRQDVSQEDYANAFSNLAQLLRAEVRSTTQRQRSLGRGSRSCNSSSSSRIGSSNRIGRRIRSRIRSNAAATAGAPGAAAAAAAAGVAAVGVEAAAAAARVVAAPLTSSLAAAAEAASIAFVVVFCWCG